MIIKSVEDMSLDEYLYKLWLPAIHDKYGWYHTQPRLLKDKNESR